MDVGAVAKRAAEGGLQSLRNPEGIPTCFLLVCLCHPPCVRSIFAVDFLLEGTQDLIKCLGSLLKKKKKYLSNDASPRARSHEEAGAPYHCRYAEEMDTVFTNDRVKWIKSSSGTCTFTLSAHEGTGHKTAEKGPEQRTNLSSISSSSPLSLALHVCLIFFLFHFFPSILKTRKSNSFKAQADIQFRFLSVIQCHATENEAENERLEITKFRLQGRKAVCHRKT